MNTLFSSKGKPAALARAEKILSEFIDPKTGCISNGFCLDKKAQAKVADCFKEQFNYIDFSISVPIMTSVIDILEIIEMSKRKGGISGGQLGGKMAQMLLQFPNAFTFGSFPDATRLLLDPPLRPFNSEIITKEGYISFKRPVQTGFVTIYSSLVTILTPDEFMAIILHEIGHDFYAYGPVGFALYSMITAMTVGSHFLIKYASIPLSFTISWMKDITLNNKVGKCVAETLGIIRNLAASGIAKTASLLNFGVILAIFQGKIGINPMIAIGGAIRGVIGEGRANETFADRFACQHGYTGAMATAMFKLHNFMNPQGFFGGGDGEVAVNIITAWSGFALKMLTNPFEEHPHPYTRIDMAYELAEKNLKGCKNKEMMAALKESKAKALKAKEQYEEQYTRITAKFFKMDDDSYTALADLLGGDTMEDYESRASLKEEASPRGNIFLSENKTPPIKKEKKDKTLRNFINKLFSARSKAVDKKINSVFARAKKSK